MGTDFIWGVLPKNVQELNQSYDLFKKVITDFGKIISGFRRFWRFRKKAKMKKAVLGIRAHVGVIDSIFSTLRAKMRIALDRNDRTGFKMHQDEICQIYSRVTDTSHELLQALSVCERYLDGYPKLKDALHLKLESEGVDEASVVVGFDDLVVGQIIFITSAGILVDWPPDAECHIFGYAMQPLAVGTGTIAVKVHWMDTGIWWIMFWWWMEQWPKT